VNGRFAPGVLRDNPDENADGSVNQDENASGARRPAPLLHRKHSANSVHDAATISRGAAAKRGFAGASIARDCRRQVKSRLAEMLLRRATSETFAPGTSVSSTNRVFSSDDTAAARPCQEPQLASVDLKAGLKVARSKKFRLQSRRRWSDGWILHLGKGHHLAGHSSRSSPMLGCAC
jgi:hypothetical protein